MTLYREGLIRIKKGFGLIRPLALYREGLIFDTNEKSCADIILRLWTLDREGLIRICLVPLRNMNLVSSKKLVVKNPMTSDLKSKARSVQSLKIISAHDFSFGSALHDPKVA